MAFLDNCVGCEVLPSITDNPDETRILPWSKWNPTPQNLLNKKDDTDTETTPSVTVTTGTTTTVEDGVTTIVQTFMRGDF